ncbi:MAG: DUF3108 domain-containing protein [Desulfobacterales bacterium]|nr:MAG: DUF3108 domain-containing protein [Desulfobacterales bacterium]
MTVLLHPLEKISELSSNAAMTRRDCLRFILGAWGFISVMPPSFAKAAIKSERRSIVDHFLGEELIYHIGYWRIPHCGDAESRFAKTNLDDIYQISLQGRAVGFIDAALGGLQYSYVSYSQYLEQEDRLRPLFFQSTKRRMGKEKHRSITFDYAAQKVFFSKTRTHGKTQVRQEPMLPGRIYEDYLTLSYNFRHGHYGPLERGVSYQLPIQIRKRMKSLKLQIVSREEEKKYRQKESVKTDKDFFLKFQVEREDVSSGSGEIEGWVSSEAIPIKGTVKDVILFGDLWGELIERRVKDSNRIVAIPDNLKNEMHLP